MIRFKKDETPTVAAPASVKSETAKPPADAVGTNKATRQKTPKAREAEPKSPESLELFRPAAEQDAE